jgi:hypothetical protein
MFASTGMESTAKTVTFCGITVNQVFFAKFD